MNRRNIIIIISILAFIVIVGGVSYSYFMYNKNIGDVSINTGDISINFSNTNGNQTLTNVIPLTDYEGMNSSNYFDFTVTSTVDTERIYYEIYLLPSSGNTLDTSYLKTYLTDQSNNKVMAVRLYDGLSSSEVENGKVIYKDIIETNNGTTRTETKNFRLRLWLDENYSELTSKTFAFDLYLYAKNVDNDYVIPIDTCPGCKFLYTTTNSLTTWNLGGYNSSTDTSYHVSPSVITTGLYDNYQELVSTTGKNYFLGVKLNSNNEAEEAYACGIKDDVPFCIRGSLSTSEGGTSSTVYEDNKIILQSPAVYNNTCSVFDAYVGTPYQTEITDCGLWDNENISVYATGEGLNDVGIDDGMCYVDGLGRFKCD